MNQGIKQIAIQRFENLSVNETLDYVSIEEPLEIQLEYGSINQRQKKVVSVTMRTPGNDLALAIGFLFTEGIIKSVHDFELDSLKSTAVTDNTIELKLKPEVTVNLGALDRNFYTTSSCGVCGKTSIDAIKQQCQNVIENNLFVPSNVLGALQQQLHLVQTDFNLSGGIHASALFSTNGNLLAFKEDVGRHNALDKLIGDCLLNSENVLTKSVLLLSGRASFELIQKAAMAGIPIIAAVGAPSSLAVETAQNFRQTLVGFLKNNRFNIYCGPERIVT